LSLSVRVAIVGPMTIVQEAECWQRYVVSVDRCIALLRFFRDANVLHEKCEIVEDELSASVGVNWCRVEDGDDIVRVWNVWQ
jgi:hypothetical protein